MMCPSTKKQILADSHTHSRNSFDGSASVRALCEGARRRGIRYLTVTDHYDCNELPAENLGKTQKASFAEISACAQGAPETVTVLSGMELGQPLQALAWAERLLAAEPCDFVLGSLHNLENFSDFYDLDYTAQPLEPLFDRYFSEMLDMIAWGNFDSLAHLSYPLRYLPDGFSQAAAYFKSGQDSVLRALAKAGKALEINTSGLRQRIGVTLPDADTVRRFRELGGELITLGSDAHTAEDVGAGIAEGVSIAAAAGFSRIAVYRNRKPELLPIE